MRASSVRNAKRMHGVVILLNATRDCVASVIEFVCGAADLDARRTVAWPEASPPGSTR